MKKKVIEIDESAVELRVKEARKRCNRGAFSRPSEMNSHIFHAYLFSPGT